MMHGHEKSSSAIVAVKPTNKAERSAAEPVEPRAEAEGNAGQQSTHRAQYRVRGTDKQAAWMNISESSEERGELLLLPLPCCLPYARQRL